MVFAKSARFKQHFYQEMRSRNVHKRYKALVTGGSRPPPPNTTVTHYMLQSTYSPKVLSPTSRNGWLECRLRIVASSPLLASELTSVAAALASKAALGEGGVGMYEVEVELLTGRTHQIRAQMSGVCV